MFELSFKNLMRFFTSFFFSTMAEEWKEMIKGFLKLGLDFLRILKPYEDTEPYLLSLLDGEFFQTSPYGTKVKSFLNFIITKPVLFCFLVFLLPQITIIVLNLLCLWCNYAKFRRQQAEFEVESESDTPSKSYSYSKPSH